MRVLITRPREDAEALARSLADDGIDSLIEPMLSVVPRVGAELDLTGAQAVLLTSANGARALAAGTSVRDIAVLAVGEATATAARAAGFAEVAAAAGDVAALADLATRRCAPRDGALVHVSGSVTAGDLAGRLGDAGFTVRSAVLYEAHAASALSAGAVDALSAGGIDAVLLYSPRTAGTFVALVGEAGLGGALASVQALCLSAAVADAARAATWREVRTAERPEQAALLALIESRDRSADG